MSIITGALYIVATPIGNLSDITHRAVDVLSHVDLIAAEDTRHSRKLLGHYGIKSQCVSLHEHNERQYAPRLIQRLQAGQSIAVISDAGTPLINDPGFILVKEARQAGIDVIPIPGPSAVITALSVAGLSTARFIFEGFLPSKAVERERRLALLATEQRTLVFYESCHRIADTLQAMVFAFGEQRSGVVARELTKLYESVRSGTLSALLDWVANNEDARRGEFVIVVAGDTPTHDAENAKEVDRVLCTLLEELSVKQAARLASGITGISKNKLYKQALRIAESRK